MSLPTDDKERKALPIWTGVIMYWPDVWAEIAKVSKAGNDQHNPGQPLHWARGKSMDQMNTSMRHMLDHATGNLFNVMPNGEKVYHLAQSIWRQCAELQLTIERERARDAETFEEVTGLPSSMQLTEGSAELIEPLAKEQPSNETSPVLVAESDAKFELTGDKKNRLFQIRALKSFGTIGKGDLGGWVAKESNLSQFGDAWVYDNAQVYGNAQVFGDAQVFGNALVYGDARVYGNAWVYGDSRVYGDAQVFGDAQVLGDAQVYGNAWVSAGRHK